MRYKPYPTDQQWIQALKAGEVEAWGEVPNDEAGVSATGLLGMLYHWARWDTHDPDQAKDIAVEAGCQVLRHLDGFRGETAFERWLRRVYRSVLFKRAPGFQYKLRSKLERWLQTADQRGLEQRYVMDQAINKLRPDEQQVMELVKRGEKTEQIATELGVSVPVVRALKNQGLTNFLGNQAFMAMLIRVGNRNGAQKDKLAANIVAAYRELQEVSIEALLKPDGAEGDDVAVWDVLPASNSMPDTDLSERLNRFWACVDRLPQAKKAVIQLTWRYRLGRPASASIDEQIAEELGITPELVRLRRFQARKPLKRCMDEEA